MRRYIIFLLAVLIFSACEKSDVSGDLCIGDYYHGEGKFGKDFGVDGPQGIVFRLPSNGKPGLVVSYSEPEKNWGGYDCEEGFLQWSEGEESLGNDSWNNGMSNMINVYAKDASFVSYPAFAWVNSLNSKEVVYERGAKYVWYLPSMEELEDLYAVLPTVNPRFGWDMPCIDTLDVDIYLSSTEYEGYADQVYSMAFSDGEEVLRNKHRTGRVRAVLAF